MLRGCFSPKQNLLAPHLLPANHMVIVLAVAKEQQKVAYTADFAGVATQSGKMLIFDMAIYLF